MTKIKNLQPLIKWAGGKRSEIKYLKAHYPKNIDRVVEPFFGGGAVSFDLNKETIINDVSKDLISFYNQIKNDSNLFTDKVLIVDKARKEISHFINSKTNDEIKDLILSIKKYVLKVKKDKKIKNINSYLNINDSLNLSKLGKEILELNKKIVNFFPSFLQKDIEKDLSASLKSKLLIRIPNLEVKNNVNFKEKLQKDHLETALQSGIYTTIRRLYNNEYPLKEEDKIWSVSSWFIIRNLCYSGMFRFGKNNKFNVPYGGIGYNSRDFEQTLKYIQSKEVKEFLEKGKIHSVDFEVLFKEYNYFNKNDFVFLDPPYDTAFSQYNPDGDFTLEDHKRLAKQLLKIKGKWMLVIKKTEFINSLYDNKKLFKFMFNKNYQVNIRNRNKSGVEHLVITNYELDTNVEGCLLKKI